jgi:hypothetical protein
MGAILAKGKMLRKARAAPKKAPEMSLAEKIKADTQAKFKRRRARVAGEEEDDTPTAAGEQGRRASLAVKVVPRKVGATSSNKTTKPASASRGGLSRLSKLVGGGSSQADDAPVKRTSKDAPLKRSAVKDTSAPRKRSAAAEEAAPVRRTRSITEDAPPATPVGPFDPSAFRGFQTAAGKGGDASDGSASDWSEA